MPHLELVVLALFDRKRGQISTERSEGVSMINLLYNIIFAANHFIRNIHEDREAPSSLFEMHFSKRGQTLLEYHVTSFAEVLVTDRARLKPILVDL